MNSDYTYFDMRNSLQWYVSQYTKQKELLDVGKSISWKYTIYCITAAKDPTDGAAPATLENDPLGVAKNILM